MKKITQQDMKELFDITQSENREDGIRYGPASLHRRRIIKEFAKNITFNSIADIGCGNGNFLKYLLKKLNIDESMINITGIDIAPKAIDKAREKFNGDFFIMDISRSKIDAKFDLVICSEVLEHIVDYKSALKNISEICIKNLILSTPCGPFGDHPGSMIRYYPKKKLISYLNKVGFQVVKCKRWGFPFFTPIHEVIIHSLGIKKNPLRTGKFGIVKKILSKILYYIFYLNIPDKGDRIFILATKDKLLPREKI